MKDSERLCPLSPPPPLTALLNLKRAFTDSEQSYFYHLHNPALMPVTSAKRSGIFPRLKDWLASDRTSHIFKNLQNSKHCHLLCSADCFMFCFSNSFGQIYCTCFNLILFLFLSLPWGSVYRFLHSISLHVYHITCMCLDTQ